MIIADPQRRAPSGDVAVTSPLINERLRPSRPEHLPEQWRLPEQPPDQLPDGFQRRRHAHCRPNRAEGTLGGPVPQEQLHRLILTGELPAMPLAIDDNVH